MMPPATLTAGRDPRRIADQRTHALFGRFQTRAAHQHGRNALVRLPHEERGRGREFIRHRHFRHLQQAPEKIRVTDAVHDRPETRATDGKSRDAVAPRATRAVVDDHIDRASAAFAHTLAERSRACIRVFRQQQNAIGILYVRPIDTGVRVHIAQTVLDDQRARPLAQHRHRFAQDDLDEAWVFVRQRRETQRLCRGLDLAEVCVAVFGFGDDLLRDDEEITLFDAARHAIRGRHDRPGDIIAGLDERDAGERVEA